MRYQSQSQERTASNMYIEEHKVFKDCHTKIEDKCRERFNDVSAGYDPKTLNEAKERMEFELNLIKGNGYSYTYFLLLNISEWSKRDREIIKWVGCITYSYVAYLLQITNIDPVKMHYPPEFLFGYYYDRMPGIMFYASWDYRQTVAEHMRTLFGKDMVEIDGDNVIIGEGPVRKNKHYPDVFRIALFEEELWEHYNSPADYYEECKALKPDVYPRGYFADDGISRDSVYSELLYYGRALRAHDYGAAYIFDGLTYRSVINALGYIHGNFIYEAHVYDDEGNVLYTRDDFYRYGLKIFNGDKKNALMLMENVRKGRGDNPRLQELLRENGMDEFFCERISKVKYAVSEGDLLPIAQHIIHWAYIHGHMEDTTGVFELTDKNGNTYRMKAIDTWILDDFNQYLEAVILEDKTNIYLKFVLSEDGEPLSLTFIDDEEEYAKVAKHFEEKQE